MRNLIISTITFVILVCGTLHSQEPPAQQKAKTNEVAGLKLPAPLEVNYDEQFVVITAECKGTVKWLILSTAANPKFRVQPATPNEIIVGIPPLESVVTIFAGGIVDGKQTDFARTDILVKGPTGPGPPNPPGPQPPDPSIKPPFHLSIIEDPTRRTEAIRLIVEDPTLQSKLKAKQVTLRVYSVNNQAELQKKHFDGIAKAYGVPLMIFQDSTGRGLYIQPLPASQNDMLKLLSTYVGSF